MSTTKRCIGLAAHNIPSQSLRPTHRTNLASFFSISGNYDPVFVDIDFARKSNIPDVFAFRLLNMARRELP